MSKVSQRTLFLFSFSLFQNRCLRATLALSSLFRVGKILIYVNSDYHKLHILPSLHNRTHIYTKKMRHGHVGHPGPR